MTANEKALTFLPHGPEFRFVDHVIDLDPGKFGCAEYTLRATETFLRGHFPGAPVMPGVLVIEALAQCGAILVLREMEDRDQKLVLFTGIKEARFRRPVVPGDTLVLEVTALRTGSRIQRMRGEAKVDGQICADAELTSVIADRES